MSNLRSNLSDTLAAARARASQYHTLLSPSSSGATSSGGGSGRGAGSMLFTSLGRRMAGLSTLSPSDGDDGSGEFPLRMGGSRFQELFYYCSLPGVD
jgi:hypothetical protein